MSWQNRIIATGEVDPEQLLANPLNFRIHPRDQQEALEAVLDEVGWVQDVIVNSKTNTLIDGHLRVKLALRKGETSIPVKYVELSEQEEVQILAAFDPVAAMAATDKEKLAVLFAEIDTDNDAMNEFLQGLAEREGIEYGDEPAEDPGAQIDKAEELREKWEVESGQLWKLGEHRVIVGDCTDAAVVERLMGGERADMVFTDPPYNIDYGNIKHPKFKEREIENDNMDEAEWLNFCQQVVSIIKVSTRGCVYVCHAPAQDGRVMAKELDKAFHCSTTIIWVKHIFTLGRGKYQNRYEPIWFGWVEEGKSFVDNRTLDNVWEIDRPTTSKEHPTMKPLELVEKGISHNDIRSCFDPFLGSGTTLIACERLTRKAFGIEIEPKYVAVTLERYFEMTGDMPELVDI